MRTKEYDVNLTGRRLSIVRLKDGAFVAEAEIPVDATDAVVAVLQGGDSISAREPEAAPQKKTTRKTTKKTTSDGSVQTT